MSSDLRDVDTVVYIIPFSNAFHVLCSILGVVKILGLYNRPLFRVLITLRVVKHFSLHYVLLGLIACSVFINKHIIKKFLFCPLFFSLFFVLFSQFASFVITFLT